MSATTRLARLLALVPWLAANDGITLEAAARHFDVSVEQLEQDLWLLIVCGLPGYGPADLVDIQFWDDGRIHVIDPQTLRRPLRLTADEATALLLGLRVLQQVPGSGHGDSLDRVIGKLESAMQANARPGGADVAMAAATPSVSAALDEALATGQALALDYAAATRDEVSHRIVQPLRVSSVDGRTSLIAYCTLAEAVRTFRVDRILAASVHAAVPVPTPALGALEASIRSPDEAILILAADARWICDAHGGTVLGEEPSGGLRIALPVHDHAWLARLVLGAGPGATVVAPAEAVRAVRAAAEAALSAYA